MLSIDLASVPPILKRLDRALLNDNGTIKLYSAEFYKQIDRIDLRIWCHFRARYSIPTIELVEWLSYRIGNRTAIEIGAGNADLGYHLGIHSTDSYLQQTPLVKFQYALMGQIPTSPPDFVEKIDAMEAIKKYRPEVVIGAWITENNPNNPLEGNIHGPNDFKIVQTVGEYIHIGCHKQHGNRELLARPHETFEFPWVLSRTSQPVDDVIHCWPGDKNKK